MVKRLCLTLFLVALAAAVPTAENAYADAITIVGVDEIDQEDLFGQIGLDVTESSGIVSFAFTNDVGIASHITEIYFHEDLASWLDFTSFAVDNDEGTGATTPTFTVPTASPGHPSGLLGWGNSETGVAGDCDNGAGSSGLNESGDLVVFTFDLVSGATFANLIAALNNTQGESGALIGMHIRSIGSAGGSDTYYNGVSTPVPEPGSLALLLLGVGALGFVRSRRR